jgi:uncharacterized protein (TIGR02246 family)
MLDQKEKEFMEQTQRQTSTKTFKFQPQNQNLIQSLQSQISEFSAAFTKGDANAVTSFFTSDATLINPVGERAQGRDAILQVVQNDINTFLKGSRNEFKLENTRTISDDLMLIDMNHFVTELKTVDGKEAPSVTFHIVVLAKKVGDRWMWLDARPYSFMNMPTASVH